jgi:hypothetical protein
VAGFDQVPLRRATRYPTPPAQAISASVPDPVAKNVHVGKPSHDVDAIQLMSIGAADSFMRLPAPRDCPLHWDRV